MFSTLSGRGKPKLVAPKVGFIAKGIDWAQRRATASHWSMSWNTLIPVLKTFILSPAMKSWSFNRTLTMLRMFWQLANRPCWTHIPTNIIKNLLSILAWDLFSIKPSSIPSLPRYPYKNMCALSAFSENSLIIKFAVTLTDFPGIRSSNCFF